MKVDLHTHTNASDGTLSPVALLTRAAENGVGQLAITDHDTVAGLRQILADVESCKEAGAPSFVASGVTVVQGVEITASHNGRDYHVLGLWINIDDPELIGFLDSQRGVRELRAVEIDRRLSTKGIEGALAGARKHADGAILSRPHFARFLVEAGHCAKEQQAYKKWLGAGKVADVHCDWPTMTRAIDVIHQAGGSAVLAHPNKYGLTRTRLIGLLEAFKAMGGDGIELISGRQEDAMTKDLLKLADQYGLACSTGSDFHSPEQTWCDIGTNAELPNNALPVWQNRH